MKLTQVHFAIQPDGTWECTRRYEDGRFQLASGDSLNAAFKAATSASVHTPKWARKGSA